MKATLCQSTRTFTTMRKGRTVTRPWDLGIRLTNADVRRRVATTGSGVCRCCTGTVNLFVFFLHPTGVALPCCPERRTLFRRQWRLRLTRGTWRPTLGASRYGRRGSSAGTSGNVMWSERILSPRLVQDTLVTLSCVWHGSLPQLSREDDTTRLVRRRRRLCGCWHPRCWQ